MSVAKEVPIASDNTEVLADWIECQTILAGAGQCSRVSLVRALRRSGTIDTALSDEDDESLASDPGSVVSLSVADGAFAEIEERGLACGDSYPFEVGEGSVQLRAGLDLADSDYIFLLLLTKLGPTGGHDGTAALFEHLCTHAAHQYLGGTTNTAKVLRVGAPRRPPLASLRDAIDHMCAHIKEGGGCKPAKRKGRNTGDGQLDIVAWRHFPNDDRMGKLIAFGQCAAGVKGWEGKLNELDSVKFSKKFLREPLIVDPIRLFFVPWRVSQKQWADISTDAGIVFDRSRIVACLDSLAPDLSKRRREATQNLIKMGKQGKAAKASRSQHDKGKKKTRRRAA